MDRHRIQRSGKLRLADTVRGSERRSVMPPRTLLLDDALDAAILAAVDRWAALLELEQYQATFDATDHDPAKRAMTKFRAMRPHPSPLPGYRERGKRC
jgi:hypothetical protein